LTGLSKISSDYGGRFAIGGTIEPILAADVAPAAFGRVSGEVSREIFIPGKKEAPRPRPPPRRQERFCVADGASLSGRVPDKKKPGGNRRA
jgi:hypothetical protein